MEFSNKYKGVVRVTNSLIDDDVFNMINNFKNMFPKLVLTGGVVLSLLKIVKRQPNDLDFCLVEKLTPNELDTLRDFFDLKWTNEGREYKDEYGKTIEIKKWDPEKITKEEEIIQLYKEYYDQEKSPPQFIKKLKIDIFNKELLKPHNMFFIEYWKGGYKQYIRCVHPSRALSYKMKYATDNRIGSWNKHQVDIRNIDWDKFNRRIRLISFTDKLENLTDWDNQNWNT